MSVNVVNTCIRQHFFLMVDLEEQTKFATSDSYFLDSMSLERTREESIKQDEAVPRLGKRSFGSMTNGDISHQFFNSVFTPVNKRTKKEDGKTDCQKIPIALSFFS